MFGGKAGAGVGGGAVQCGAIHHGSHAVADPRDAPVCALPYGPKVS